MVDGHEMEWFWRLFLNTGGKKGQAEGDWLFGPHAFPTHWLMLPMPRLPQRVCGLPATSDSPQPPHCSSPAAGLALTDFLLRTLFLWYPQACLLTSLGSLPKCRFPRDGFPIKKKKSSSSSLPSVKNNAPHCLKALTLLCLHNASLQICSSL